MPPKKDLIEISKQLKKASNLHKRQSNKVAAISRKKYVHGGGVRKAKR